MALLSDLVAICAEQRLDSEATLNLFARRLREAGRVSKAGRGRGAAKMTYLDGARFLIACAATDHPEKVSDAEGVFSSLLLTETFFSEPGHSKRQEGDLSALDQGLATVLEQLASGRLDEQNRALYDARLPFAPSPIVDLRVLRGGAQAVLRSVGAEMHYSHPAQAKMHTASDSDELRAMADAWMQETARFRTGKNLQATFDLPLLRAVADGIAGKAATA